MGTVGIQLRQWREDNDLTQEEAARIIGISGSEVSRIETGNRPRLEGMTLVKVARALGKTVEDLMATEQVA